MYRGRDRTAMGAKQGRSRAAFGWIQDGLAKPLQERPTVGLHLKRRRLGPMNSEEERTKGSVAGAGAGVGHKPRVHSQLTERAKKHVCKAVAKARLFPPSAVSPFCPLIALLNCLNCPA